MRQEAFPTLFRPNFQRVSTLSGTHFGPYTEVMQLRTLGGLKLEGAAFSRPKPLLLLAYLALEGPQERRHLGELFWPGPNYALRNLSTVLTRLKEAASDVVEGDGVRIWTTLTCDAQLLLTALEKRELEEPASRRIGGRSSTRCRPRAGGASWRSGCT